MPSVKLLRDSNVTLKPLPLPPPHDTAHQQQRFAPHVTLIYLAFAVLAVISLVRLAGRLFTPFFTFWARGRLQSERRQPDSPKDSKAYSWDAVAAVSTSTTSTTPNKPLFFRPGFIEGEQTTWVAGLLGSPAADQVRTGLTPSALGMEERRDRSGSRGVSTSAAGRGLPVPSSRADQGARKSSRSPRSHKSSASSSGAQSNSSDASARVKDKGKGLMDGDTWGAHSNRDTAVDHLYQGTDGVMHSQHGESSDYEDGAVTMALGFARPVPPPPLTPPTLYTGSFTFQDRRPSYAVSVSGQRDAGFIHQANPDYMSASTSAEYHNDPVAKSATTTPRRRSYTRSIPIAIALPSGSTSSSSHQSQDVAWGVSSADTFSPASYPPSSPQLPPPPPGSYDEIIYDYDNQQEEEIDLQGEIISVMDDAGHGWKRHTRVYGGGVCLACVAAGGRQGGFYGDKVPLSERR